MKGFQSGAEVTSPRFSLWNKSRRDMDLADSDLSTIIFKETLKDYEMLIGEDYKRSESGAEDITPRFTCGIKAVAIWISRIQILSWSSPKNVLKVS